MTEALRKKARQRFQSWTDWYRYKGYRARSPGTNYQAGYLIAATFIATARRRGRQGGRPAVEPRRRRSVGPRHGEGAAAGKVLDGGDLGRVAVRRRCRSPSTLWRRARSARTVSPSRASTDGTRG